jgi:hypothetical protein
MTPEEFDFWQRAYLIALERVTASSGTAIVSVTAAADAIANLALRDYRAAKATVVQTDNAINH